eukprot:GSMAST32.ASY1.ANO1.2687.1 assembled CDS
MLARTFCHPLDTCKARLQVRVRLLNSPNHLNIAKSTIRGELRSLYSGFGTTFFGSCPAGCLYFAGYESSKTVISSVTGFPESNALTHLTAGVLAEIGSCVLWVPIDVIKERLQTQTALYGHANLPYRGNLHAIQTITRREGFKNLYKGYGATVLSFGPFSGLYFMFYEKFKALAFKITGVHPNSPENLPIFPMLWFGSCGALAGSIAGFITNPLDLAKLRIQVQRGNKNTSIGTSFNYKNIFDAIRQICIKEGYTALWKGSAARIAFQAPTTAIGIASFEQFRVLYSRYIFTN